MRQLEGVVVVNDSFPALSSLLDGAALAARVLPQYPLAPPLTCGLLARGEHDNYLVTAGEGDSGRYVLRVHTHERGLPQTAVEEQARIVAGLAAAGVAVESPVARCDGGYVTPVLASEGERFALLVRFVPGAPVATYLTPAQAERYGELAARTHAALDAVSSSAAAHRPTLDLAYLLDEPLRMLAPLGRQHPALWDELTVRARELAERLRALALPREPPAWGLCHGDLHKRNVLYNGDDSAPTLMDWDCLGTGWRAYDLASLRRSLGRMVEPAQLSEDEADALFGAFLRGYTRLRPLSGAEMAAIPLFVPMRQLWIRGVGVAGALAGGWHPAEFGAAWFEALVGSLHAWMEAAAQG